MEYQKVKPGDDLSIDSDTWNLLLQMANDYRQQNGGGLTQKPTQRRESDDKASDVALVKNTTTDNIKRYSVIYVSGALIEPATNQGAYENKLVFAGGKPTSTSMGRFGVLLDSLTPSQIGRVAMIGVVQCWINIVSTSDTMVESVGGSYIPNSGKSGTASILYVAGGVGSATATGPQYATIRIGGGGGPSGPIEVRCVKDGGSDGQSAYPGLYASWTYTLYSLTDTSLLYPLANKVPLFPRRPWACQTTPGTYGLAFQVTDNTIVGAGGSAGQVPNMSSSSSSSAPLQPYRLSSIDESYSQVDCSNTTPPMSSSSSGS